MHKRPTGREWPRRIRDPVLMGLIWAAVWALVGVLVGLIVDPDESMDEMWVAVGAYPGFLCGAASCVVLGVTKGRRRFDQLSLSQVGAWGAASGLLVGVIPSVALALVEPAGLRGRLVGALIITSFALLSAASAAGLLAIAKWWRRENGSTPVLR